MEQVLNYRIPPRNINFPTILFRYSNKQHEKYQPEHTVWSTTYSYNYISPFKSIYRYVSTEKLSDLKNKLTAILIRSYRHTFPVTL